MGFKAIALAISALLVLAWAGASSGGEYVDIGDGLLLRPDGTVIAAWEIPECHVAGDAFDAPESALVAPASRGVWQVRFDRGW